MKTHLGINHPPHHAGVRFGAIVLNRGKADQYIYPDKLIDTHNHIGRFLGAECPPQFFPAVSDHFDQRTQAPYLKERQAFIFAISDLDTLDHRGYGPRYGYDEFWGNLRMLLQTQSLLKENNPNRRTAILPIAACTPSPFPAANAKAAAALEFLIRESMKTETPIRALKFHPPSQKASVSISALYEPYLKLAEHYGLVCCFHSETNEWSHPQALIGLAAKHPNVPFILYHTDLTGQDDAKRQVFASVASAREAGVDNIYLETSFFADNNPWLIREAIQAVGSDRVVFGTDGPIQYRGPLQNTAKQYVDHQFFRVLDFLEKPAPGQRGPDPWFQFPWGWTDPQQRRTYFFHQKGANPNIETILDNYFYKNAEGIFKPSEKKIPKAWCFPESGFQKKSIPWHRLHCPPGGELTMDGLPKSFEHDISRAQHQALNVGSEQIIAIKRNWLSQLFNTSTSTAEELTLPY